MKITVKNRIFRQQVKLHRKILDSTHRITFKWRWRKGDLCEVKRRHSLRKRKKLRKRLGFESFPSIRFDQSIHPSRWYVGNPNQTVLFKSPCRKKKYFNRWAPMTSSLEDLSGSPNIKDYKLEFNKVSRSVPITGGTDYSNEKLFVLFRRNLVDGRTDYLKMEAGSPCQNVVSWYSPWHHISRSTFPFSL